MQIFSNRGANLQQTEMEWGTHEEDLQGSGIRLDGIGTVHLLVPPGASAWHFVRHSPGLDDPFWTGQIESAGLAWPCCRGDCIIESQILTSTVHSSGIAIRKMVHSE